MEQMRKESEERLRKEGRQVGGGEVHGHGHDHSKGKGDDEHSASPVQSPLPLARPLILSCLSEYLLPFPWLYRRRSPTLVQLLHSGDEGFLL